MRRMLSNVLCMITMNILELEAPFEFLIHMHHKSGLEKGLGEWWGNSMQNEYCYQSSIVPEKVSLVLHDQAD